MTIIAVTPEWVVVSKPAGILTIPGRDTAAGTGQTLVDWVKERYSTVWVVHRLDRETSGVVLFARTPEAHRKANSWFQDRKTKKVYHCLAAGVPKTPIFKVQDPIEGAPSVSQVEVRESYQEGFLARVLPRTGRRHQIRIHLAQRGHPIWGDPTYQGPRQVQLAGEALEVSRVALHASQLELPSGEKFEAAFPEDFSFWLERLRKEGRRV